MNFYLAAPAYTTGRFIDPEWLGEKRALYTVSPPSVM
jgi:hypothetical protein